MLTVNKEMAGKCKYWWK